MQNKLVLAVIMVGVLAWGAFHAIGAYWNYRYGTLSPLNAWRSAVVFGCVVAFVAFWGVMLAQRNARLRRIQLGRTELGRTELAGDASKSETLKPRRLGPGDAC